MTYLLCGAVCVFLGLSNGLGGATLLRPILDVISPLSAESVGTLCALASLCSALVSAFFALNRRLPLHQDDLLMIAVGAALGGVLGDLAASHFFAALSQNTCVFLQNALLFTLLALALLYIQTLSHTLIPFSLDRVMTFPVAAFCGLIGSFLSFGAVPLSLILFHWLFDAEDEEASFAALTIAVCAMVGKALVMLIRSRFSLPDADALLWLLPGVVGSALLAMFPRTFRITRASEMLLRFSAFTSLLNIASASLGAG